MGSRCSLDRRRDDRLGRIQRQPSRPSQHRGEILCGIWSNFHTHANGNCEPDTNRNTDDYANGYIKRNFHSYCYADRDSYSYSSDYA
jgi:hypothetical protein